MLVGVDRGRTAHHGDKRWIASMPVTGGIGEPGPTICDARRTPALLPTLNAAPANPPSKPSSGRTNGFLPASLTASTGSRGRQYESLCQTPTTPMPGG